MATTACSIPTTQGDGINPAELWTDANARTLRFVAANSRTAYLFDQSQWLDVVFVPRPAAPSPPAGGTVGYPIGG